MLIYLPNLVTKVQQDLIESISSVLILGKISPTGSLANSFPFKDDLYGNSYGGRPVLCNDHQASGRGSGGKVLGMKRTMSIIPFDDRDGVIWFDGKLMRSEEHTSELQSLMRISYAVFCLKKKNNKP